MSFMLLGILNSQAAGGISYWFATLGGASDDYSYGGATDSEGNAYSLGRVSAIGAGSDDFFLAKHDSAGAVQWQRTLGGSSNEQPRGVAVDSSDNVYVVGDTGSEGAGNDDSLIAKYNSSGVIQWQRILGASSSDVFYSVAFDSSDNIYAFGQSYSASLQNEFLLAKYNSSGTIQWQRTLGSSSDYEIGASLAVDSSNQIYTLGKKTAASGFDQTLILAKYNSSGTLQWQRSLGAASDDAGNSVAIDSSDNIYAFGVTESQGAGGADCLLVKYNSSGTIQWQKVLGATGSEAGNSVAIDSADSIYVFGNTQEGEGGNDFLLAKYNSSGTIQWQRTLGATSNESGVAISIDPSGNLLAFGYTTSTGEGGADLFLAKLPSDGSLTGTYELDGVDFVYAASSLTAATSTLTAATSTLTAATSTLTAATSTLTDASASLTSHFVEIPA